MTPTLLKRIRIHAVAVRRNKRIVSVLVVALLMFAAILVFFHALWVRNLAVANGIREDALWATYQADREAGRLVETLDQAIDGYGDVTVADVTRRFDILYSRHEVMEDADFPSKFRDNVRLKAASERFATELHDMVAVFDRFAAEGQASREDLVAMMGSARALRETTEALLVATNQIQSSLRTDERAETTRIYAWLAAAVAAMTLAMMAVIVMIWRQVEQLELGRRRLQRLSEELTQSAAAAEAGNKAKSAFLATMSHEIRTPLNGITGMVELLAATDLSEAQREELATIRRCSDGLIALINDILDFSKLESGKIDLEHRPTDLGEVIESVVDMFAPTAQAKGLALVASHPLAAYVTDPTRFRQILINLVGNAVKFTDDGVVAIRIREIRHRGEEIALGVVVEDTGIGMSEEQVGRLFREFTQADVSINRRFGGTGLGLAISRRIVDALGGRIEAESRPGVGTTFHFEIPVTRVPGREAPAAPPGVDVGVTAAPLVCSVVERDLSLMGLSAHRAASGERRLRIALYDGESYEAARDGGRLPRGAEVVVIGPSARRFQNEVADVIDGAVTSGRLARLIARRVAGTRRLETARGEIEAVRQVAGGRGRALVVEDNEVNRRVATGLMARLGFSCEIAADGRQAVERMERGGIDVVLMDMQMPVMDGLEATRRIRAAEAGGRHVPIVGLTANAFGSDRAACFEAGMDEFVIKPVTRDRLAEAVDAVLAAAPAVEVVAVPASVVAAGPAGDTVPVLDRAHRALLAEELGADGLAELTAIFHDDAAQQMRALEAAWAAGDRDGVRKGLHTLKGAAGNVGLSGVVAVVDDLRAGGGLDDTDAIGRLCAALLAAADALARETVTAEPAVAQSAATRLAG